MDALLNELKMVPGILGSFVYASNYGITGSNLPAMFRDEALRQIGGVLTRIFKMSDSSGLTVNGYEIKYEEALMLIKRVDADCSFIIICEPTANYPFINMTASMMVPEVKTAIEQIRKMPQDQVTRGIPVTAPIAAPVKEPPREVIDPTKVIKEGALAPVLDRMKVCLARSIGPIANLVLQETVSDWLAKGPPAKTRLRELANLMAAQIGDKSQEKKFFEEISKIID